MRLFDAICRREGCCNPEGNSRQSIKWLNFTHSHPLHSTLLHRCLAQLLSIDIQCTSSFSWIEPSATWQLAPESRRAHLRVPQTPRAGTPASRMMGSAPEIYRQWLVQYDQLRSDCSCRDTIPKGQCCDINASLCRPAEMSCRHSLSAVKLAAPYMGSIKQLEHAARLAGSLQRAHRVMCSSILEPACISRWHQSFLCSTGDSLATRHGLLAIQGHPERGPTSLGAICTFEVIHIGST